MRGKSLQEEQTQLLYASLPNSLGTSIVIGAILAWMQSEAVSLSQVSLWFGILLLVSLARLGLLIVYRKSPYASSSVSQPNWQQYFRLGAFAAGCSWGLASLLLFVPGEPIYHLILSFALAGIAAGGITSLSIDRQSVLLFIIPILSPLLLRFTFSEEHGALRLSIMVALFLAFLIGTSIRLQRMIGVQAKHKIQQELVRQQSLGKAIVNTQSEFIAEEEPHKAFDLLLNELLSVTESEYGFIGEVLHKSDGTPYLKTYAITNIAWNDETRNFYDNNAPSGLEFLNLNTLFGHVIQHQEVVISNSPKGDPRSGGLPEGHPDLNAFLGLPITSGDKLIAMVGLANRAAGYDEELVSFLQPILTTASQLVVALEHKRREKEIQSTIKRLSLVASETNNGVVIADTAGKIEWVNEAFLAMTGYSLEELEGVEPGKFLQGEETDVGAVQTMRTALSDKHPFHVEIINYHKDGTPYWVYINCTPTYDDDGNHQGFIAIETDISERKANEQKITETTKLLSSVLDAASEVGIISTDTNGIVTVFNQGAEKMLGYKAEDLIDKQTPALWHVKSEVAARGQELSSLLGHKVEGFRVFVELAEREGFEKREWTIITRSGEHKTAHIAVTAVRSDKDEITGYLGVLHDVTEQKKSQEEIRKFKNTLDKTLDCVFMFDASTLQFFYVNQGAINQIGYSGSELMTMHPYDIKPEFSRDEFKNFIRPMVEGKQSSITFETVQRHKDGHDIPVEVFLQYIAPEGEQARFVAIVRDITERKRIEKLKNEFVSTVSHELRTPLTSICGALGLIAGTSMEELSAQNRQLIEIANSNSQRLSGLINDLLDMEKIAAGKMDFSMKSEALMPLIEKALIDNQGYAEKYDVQFKIGQHADDIHINIDAQRLQQILSNLLSNAAKFSSPGDNIEVDCELMSNSVRIAVIDHGQGIPEAFKERLFDKFSQADSSDTRQKGGTGLGLAITRELTLRMHGQIGFASEEGKGTTFWVEFPILF